MYVGRKGFAWRQRGGGKTHLLPVGQRLVRRRRELALPWREVHLGAGEQADKAVVRGVWVSRITGERT
jgi:hypothetical protein